MTSNSKSACEIGTLEMPPLEWLFTAVAAFQQNYGQIHPYLAVGLCIAGTIMNFVTVLVLTRPSMRSPVNVLLCAVACCDILVEVSYLIFVLHFLLASAYRCEPSDFSWWWAVFMMFHAHASVIFHAASIWMLVVMAQLRVLTIRRATKGPTTPLTTERFTALIALLTTLTMTIVNIPNFLTFEIMEEQASVILPCWQPPTTIISSTSYSFISSNSLTNVPSNTGIEGFLNITSSINNTNKIRKHRLKRFQRELTTDHFNNLNATTQSPILNNEPIVYTVRAHESDCMNLKLAFWTNGILFKVIPCILLTLSIAALLRIIADVAHKRKNLAQVMRKKVPKDHTTPMLAAILTIFLLAELPQGLLLVLNGIFSSESFHKRVYLPLGDLMDLLSLLNSAVGFLIYVGMSRKFRTVFLQIIFSFLHFIFSKFPCSKRFSSNEWANGNEEEREYCKAIFLRKQQQQFSQSHYSIADQPSCCCNSTILPIISNGGGNGEILNNGGRSYCKWKCRNGGGRGRKIKEKKRKRQDDEYSWLNWRRFSRSRTTELTNRTEQLSICPSSILGLPPITLAASCSAGITAAAASVGVHLLQLEASPSALETPDQEKLSPFGSLLLLPKMDQSRRASNESQQSFNNNQFLDVPDQKRASFLSLREEKRRATLETNQILKKPEKRISFNLPNHCTKLRKNLNENEVNSKRNKGIAQLRRNFLLSLASKRRESLKDIEGQKQDIDSSKLTENPLLKVESNKENQQKRRLSTTLVKVLLGKLPQNNSERSIDSVSNSPHRKMYTLSAETNFVGWTPLI